MENELKELSKKVDKILEMQELIFSKLNQGIILTKEPLITNPTFKKLSKIEQQNQIIAEIKEKFQLKHQYGGVLQRQFNLVVEPSIERIKAYLRTKDESAFDGLKRNKQ